jgi:hypothetical protein
LKFKGSGPLVVFVRLKGPTGRVREVSAVIEPSYEYCLMLRNDAATIGYPSVTSRPEDWADAFPNEVVNILSFRGIELGTLVKIKEVSIGPLKAENVEAVVTKSEFSITSPVGMFLGRSFLKHFKLEVDPAAGTFSLS